MADMPELLTQLVERFGRRRDADLASGTMNDERTRRADDLVTMNEERIRRACEIPGYEFKD